MKIKLANEQEIVIKRLSKTYHAETSSYDLNIVIDTSERSLEDIVNALSEANTKSVTLIRDDTADVVFTDLKLTFSSEDITELNHEINAFFDLKPSDANLISEE